MSDAWWCTAYGPPSEGVTAQRWPRCFLTADVTERHCATRAACADTMATERARVFARLNELSVDDGPDADTYRYLAEHFPTPGDLLAGPGEDET